LLQFINFKVNRMILYCCHLYEPDLLVTFVMLEDWLLRRLVLDSASIYFAAVRKEQCYELQPTFQLLLKRPDSLAFNVVEDTGLVHLVGGVDDMNIVYQQLYQ
ncbi:hypothetical protein UlMin_028853, partial [Ulmus minor]